MKLFKQPVAGCAALPIDSHKHRVVIVQDEQVGSIVIDGINTSAGVIAVDYIQKAANDYPLIILTIDYDLFVNGNTLGSKLVKEYEEN